MHTHSRSVTNGAKMRLHCLKCIPCGMNGLFGFHLNQWKILPNSILWEFRSSHINGQFTPKKINGSLIPNKSIRVSYPSSAFALISSTIYGPFIFAIYAHRMWEQLAPTAAIGPDDRRQKGSSTNKDHINQ